MTGKEFILMAKLRSVQHSVDEIADYLFLVLPPKNDDTMRQFKITMARRANNARQKKHNEKVKMRE